MIKDDFERKFQRECKIVMIICFVLIVIVIVLVVYSCQHKNKLDQKITRWDLILEEAEK